MLLRLKLSFCLPSRQWGCRVVAQLTLNKKKLFYCIFIRLVFDMYGFHEGCIDFSKFDSIGTIELQFSRFDLFVITN
jgi:hypothetical protein